MQKGEKKIPFAKRNHNKSRSPENHKKWDPLAKNKKETMNTGKTLIVRITNVKLKLI